MLKFRHEPDKLLAGSRLQSMKLLLQKSESKETKQSWERDLESKDDAKNSNR